MRRWSRLRPKPRQRTHLKAITCQVVDADVVAWVHRHGGRVIRGESWSRIVLRHSPDLHITQAESEWLFDYVTPGDFETPMLVMDSAFGFTRLEPPSYTPSLAVKVKLRHLGVTHRAVAAHDAALSAHVEHEASGYRAADTTEVGDLLGETGVAQLTARINEWENSVA